MAYVEGGGDRQEGGGDERGFEKCQIKIYNNQWDRLLGLGGRMLILRP